MANLVNSRSWWGARQGVAERTRFGAMTPADTAVRLGYAPIARDGELIYLTHPMTVFYGVEMLGARASRELPAGAVRCTKENLGAPFFVGGAGGASCHVRSSDLDQYLEAKPSIATKMADEGQGLRIDSAGHVYFGAGSRWIRQFVTPGSYVCSKQNFGPDPAFGTAKSCWFVPAPEEGVVEAGAPITTQVEDAAYYERLQRAEAAAQAQRDMIAAQDRVFAEQQAASAAEEQAMIAENALAQAAAALSASEAYRKVQQEAQARAAAYAAEIAALAASAHADADAAMAAAETAAEAEGVRQALAQAQAHEAEQQAAYDAAFAATQVEMRNQEQAHARVDAAQDAADQAAANAAAGGMLGSVMSGNLLLYGGLAALAALLILSDKG